MEADHRARLTERRRLLALRRKRAEISASYREVAAELCAVGVRTTKIMPVRIAELLGPLVSGPGTDEELDFGRIPGAQAHSWSRPARRDVLCRWALAAVARPQDHAAVIWHPDKAAARVSCADLRMHTAQLLDAGKGDTVWIVSAAAGPWLIQIGYWSRTVSWVASVPVH